MADPGLRPSTIATAYWLYVATAVATLVLNGIGFATSATNSARLTKAETSRGVDAAQVHSALVATLVAVIVLTIAYSALLVLFARWMRAGSPRSRVVVTVLGAVSLLSIVGFGIGAIAGLLAAFAIVFTWLPASSDWFRTAQRPQPA